MQTTSQTWKDLWAAGNAWLETKAVINGTDYTEISNPVITRAVMQNGCSIGNAVSATCRFSVRTNNAIPKSATVVIKYRLTDGTTPSEWLNAGTFYISHRSNDPVTGVITLECYDALLRSNMQMPSILPWTDNNGNVMTTGNGDVLYFSAGYPRSMSSLLSDLLYTLGITLEAGTTIETGSAYVITESDATTTINDMLCKIAAANGGNWIMTPDNKLKLVPLVSASGAASASANVVDVDGITGSIKVSSTGTITGIRYTDNGVQMVHGSETGIVVNADVSAAVAADLATKLVGMTYQAYDINAAIYDPSAELGDYVRAGANGEVSAVLCAETATFGMAFRSDMSAPEIGELADEYPYIGASFKTLEQAKLYAAGVGITAQNYASQQVQTLDNTLTQQEIFDRLTDGGLEQGLALESAFRAAPSAAGDKKLYLNMDYAKYGELEADRIAAGAITTDKIDAGAVTANKIAADAITADMITAGTMSANRIQGGTLTLGGQNNQDGQIALKDSSGTQVGTWDNDKLKLGTTNDFVQLYGNATYNGVTSKTPFYAKQTYNSNTLEMMIKEAKLMLLRGVYGLQLMHNSIALTENSGNGYEAYLDIARGYIESLTNGDFQIISDQGYVDLVGSGVKVNGTAGKSGTFTANGHTLTITNGIITNIT